MNRYTDPRYTNHPKQPDSPERFVIHEYDTSIGFGEVRHNVYDASRSHLYDYNDPTLYRVNGVVWDTTDRHECAALAGALYALYRYESEVAHPSLNRPYDQMRIDRRAAMLATPKYKTTITRSNDAGGTAPYNPIVTTKFFAQLSDAENDLAQSAIAKSGPSWVIPWILKQSQLPTALFWCNSALDAVIIRIELNEQP